MSQDERDNLENQYDINLVKAQIDQIQRSAGYGDVDQSGSSKIGHGPQQEHHAQDDGQTGNGAQQDVDGSSLLDSSFLVQAAHSVRQQQEQDAHDLDQLSHHHHHHGHDHDGLADATPQEDLVSQDQNGDQYNDSKRRKRKVFQTADGVKKCSRCRVKRVDESPTLLAKYATCQNCRNKRKVDNRHKTVENAFQLPSAKATADALAAAMDASRAENENLHPDMAQAAAKKKSKRAAKPNSSEDEHGYKEPKKPKIKDYSNLPNLYTVYDDFVERVRLNCEHDLSDHHFRGFVDEDVLSRYKYADVDAEVFQYVSRKLIAAYIQPMMDVTGYRFPVRDYHKGGSKSKRITFMFICSQDKTKQRKSRSTDQRKIANRLKVYDCSSKINANYDLCTGFLQINFSHKAHHPYIWKAQSIQLHKHSGQQFLEDVDSVGYEEHAHLNNGGGNGSQHPHHGADTADGLLQDAASVEEAANAALAHQHHHHHHLDQSDSENGSQHHVRHGDAHRGADAGDDDDNLDLNLIEGIPASSMQYLTGVDEDVAAVVNAEQRERDRQEALDRQAVEDAANRFLQAQAARNDDDDDDDVDDDDVQDVQDVQDQQTDGADVDHHLVDGHLHATDDSKDNDHNIDQELLNMS